MIFDKLLFGDINMISIILFAFGAFNLFFPLWQPLGTYLKRFECLSSNTNVVEEHYTEPYEKFRVKFVSEYDRSNPITSGESFKEYFEFLKSKILVTLAKINTEGENGAILRPEDIATMMVQQEANQRGYFGNENGVNTLPPGFMGMIGGASNNNMGGGMSADLFGNLLGGSNQMTADVDVFSMLAMNFDNGLSPQTGLFNAFGGFGGGGQGAGLFGPSGPGLFGAAGLGGVPNYSPVQMNDPNGMNMLNFDSLAPSPVKGYDQGRPHGGPFGMQQVPNGGIYDNGMNGGPFAMNNGPFGMNNGGMMDINGDLGIGGSRGMGEPWNNEHSGINQPHYGYNMAPSYPNHNPGGPLMSYQDGYNSNNPVPPGFTNNPPGYQPRYY